MVTIQLKPKKEKSIQRFHPWVFSGAIKKIFGQPIDGELVEVISSDKKFLAKGHYQEKGSISVKAVTFNDEEINEAFWQKRVADAIYKRKVSGLIGNLKTNIFRLIHAEGDLLPGLIIDYYNGVAVIQSYSIGMHEIKPIVVETLKKELSNDLIAIYDKSSETMAKVTDEIIENKYLYGSCDTPHLAKENGHTFSIDWVTGQKTGFFIDQRDNRKLLGEYSKGKKVLNTFCYSGGFSVYALDKNAELVHSLDSSEKAIELVEENVKLIEGGESHHKSIVADAMSFIKDLPEEYDIIVLDPPAFAKSRNNSHKAVQAYKRLNLAAIKQIKPGGLLFTFSCSQVIDKQLFKNTITAAAIESGREISILHQLTQPADHPVNIFHPESEYLKGLVVLVK